MVYFRRFLVAGRPLAEDIKQRILALPECSMGAHRVSLVMRDGDVLDDVVVAWGSEIVSIGRRKDVVIDAEDVIDVLDRSAG